MKRFIQFIFAHSFFAALCAAALTLKTFILISEPVNKEIILLVFFSTLGSYNLYWFISRYRFQSRPNTFLFLKHNLSYLILMLVCGVGVLCILPRLPTLIPIFVLAIFTTAAYTLPLLPVIKEKYLVHLGFLKTILLALTWTIVTVLLPTGTGISTWPVMMLFADRFLFMLLLCLLFDMRDKEVDKRHHVYSMASYFTLSDLKAGWLFIFGSYILCSVFTFHSLLPIRFLPAYLMNGFCLLILYFLAIKKQRGYYFYYFCVDGLMILSTVFVWIASHFL